MKTIVMIIVLAMHDNGNIATSTVTAEFDSLETCQQAIKSIISQTNMDDSLRVISRGCYQK